MRRLVVPAILALLTACTGSRGSPAPASSPAASPSPSGAATGPAFAGVTLDVVAPLTGPEAGGDRSYLDGMRAATAALQAGTTSRAVVVRLDVHDDRSDPARATELIRSVGPRAAALLVVGPGTELLPTRPELEAAGTPVVLFQGDLYTPDELFPEVFMASIPWRWQAHVLARYLVRDREATSIAFIGSGPEAGAARDALEAALGYWGGRLGWAAIVPAGEGPSDPVVGRAAHADAVVPFGAPHDLALLTEGLARLGARAPRIAGPETLLAAGTALPPGTTACWTSPWAGWDPPIPRVRAFVSSFSGAMGRPPVGLEQEGWDAVQALALALWRTGGRGGRVLAGALQATAGATFSAFPIALGPDDHTFMPRDELGLFAVPGPGERLDPWQGPGSPRWRPVMRTFTYDGLKTNVLDRDKPVLFPGWRLPQPSPRYTRSRYGITTGRGDPLH